MKICRLRLRNLNSLAGEWVIDFEDRCYSQGIFAITGPTGSGKTTILDGICLALYGATPRLGKIASDNEILSRGAGDCLAEVVFQVGPRRFLATWSQQRKRRGSGLAPYRHQLSELQDGQYRILEEKPGQVPGRVASVNAMDFKQFIRTTLLPQGEVAAFLRAKGADRALLLEGLSGTEIYGEISKKVHSRCRDERASLQQLEARMGDLKLLSEPQYQELKDQIGACEKARGDLEVQRQALEEKLQWYRRRQSYLQGLQEVEQLRANLSRDQQAFAPLELRLAQGEGAAKLEDLWNHLESLRNRLQEQRQQLTQLELQGQEAQLELAQSRDQDRQASEQAEALRSRVLEMTALWAQARKLDQSLGEVQEERQKTDQELAELESQGQALEEDLKAWEGQLEELGRQKSEALELWRDLEGDGLLEHSLGALEQQGRLWEDLWKACQAAQDRWEEIQRSLAEGESQLAQAVSASSLAQIAAQEAHEEAERHRGQVPQSSRLERPLAEADLAVQRIDVEAQALDELRSRLLQDGELKELERTLAAATSELDQAEATRAGELKALALASLQPLRQELQPGRPCPLCGSLHHPSPWQGDDDSQARQRLDEAEAVFQERRRCRDQVASALQSLQARQDVARDLQRQRERNLEELWGQLRAAMAALGLPPPDGVMAEDLQKAADGLEELRRRRGEAERRLQEALELSERSRQALVERQNQEAQLKALVELQRQALADAGEQLDRARQRCDDARRSFIAALEPWETREPALEGLEELFQDLRQRSSRWQQLEERLERLSQEALEAEQQRAQLQASLALIRQRRDLMARALEGYQAKVAALAAQRQELLGDDDPDQEERRWKASLDQAEELSRQAQRRHSEAQQAWAALERLREELSPLAQRIEAEATQAEARFSQRLDQEAFADVAAWQTSRLPSQELQELRQQREALKRREQDWELRNAEVQRLGQLGPEPEEDQETLEGLIQDLEDQRRHNDERLGGLKQELAQQEELKQRLAQFQQEQSQRLALCRRWERLEGLVGSADGKKFRLYAQALTFRRLIDRANSHLMEISGRYQLAASDQDPLDLNVRDLFQGGAIRSVRNLSGGESFLISLALALGLAGSAQGMKVQSLFLDEGFGSLDDQSLETVMDCLAALRQQGRQIGVISHVAALRERIAVKIQIRPGPQGWSTLEGPGCSRKVTGAETEALF